MVVDVGSAAMTVDAEAVELDEVVPVVPIPANICAPMRTASIAPVASVMRTAENWFELRRGLRFPLRLVLPFALRLVLRFVFFDWRD